MADQIQRAPEPSRNLPLLALGALGVVFGDIGTSPLYAFKLCFTGEFPAALSTANVLGILSLIFWALIVVVCVKYVTFMLRADNEGQGGTIALLALLSPRIRTAMPLALTSLAMLVLFGESMLYGDGVITPAISVISAVEGLDVVTKAAHAYVVPISVLVLIILFSMQSRGSDRIGKLFGPIMLAWFITIGVFGLLGILNHPRVIAALNPIFAVEFFLRNGLRSVLIFGAVVLCVTGVEALYADLAHFGRRPITLAWYLIVFPALLLNYFGQGALTITHAQALESPFFSLVPRSAIIPMVLLATAATVIASQALISGVFSLTQQLMQLGFAPRFVIVHTSSRHAGQIYIPAVNVVLAVTCVALVLAFRSSEAFGGAYGLAVTITMVVSSIAFFQLLLRKWNWPLWRAVPLVGLFLAWDLPFLGGNLSKVLSGGWVPLVMATTLFVLFTTWNRGRRRLLDGIAEQRLPIEEFINTSTQPVLLGDTAIFISPDSQGIPFASQHEWLRSHIVSDTIILLTFAAVSRPYLDAGERLVIEELAPRLLRMKASYGFMQQAKIADVLELLHQQRPQLDVSHVTYYLASPKMSDDTSARGVPAWQRMLYRWMARNARPLTDSLGLPPNRIMEFGVEVKI